ncbi:MAG: hypothetical protein DRO11_10130 [Methanobacteriota archaeon]|nr:MAG: hypothetical protein DRO11_10130 [Euryarchaeota archaeon]
MALGAGAVSGEKELVGSSSVTDGNPETEWRFGNTPDVLGKWIILDLGTDRAVSRVRILPGGGAIGRRASFFVKGYQIHVATSEEPNDWTLVANCPVNGKRVIDTEEDGTWVLPGPFVGRYVRVTVTREDPPNWAVVGEVEVYGDGYHARGKYISEPHRFGGMVNLGRARWEAREPPGTSLTLQFRTSPDGLSWPDWEELPSYGAADGRDGVMFPCEEPAGWVQYRALFRTEDPLRTPVLRRVEVDYDRRLVVEDAEASISPREVPVGADTTFTYTIDITCGPEDRGVDRISFNVPGRVRRVAFRGVEVPEWGWRVEDEPGRGAELPPMAISFSPEWRLSVSGRLVVEFEGAFFREEVKVRAWLADVGGTPEGEYVNPQEVHPASEGSCTVRTVGLPDAVLSRVEVRPDPFDPGRGDAVVSFDVLKVEEPRPVTVAVYDLSGRLVRTLWDGVRTTAGRRMVPWDGRDGNGRPVPPGVYIFKVEVSADVGRAEALGTITVVY